MSPGPSKRSNLHKQAVGSRHIHKGEDLAPKPITTLPHAPKSLGQEGKTIWEKQANLMIEEGILTEWDLMELEALSIEWQGYMDAVKDIQKNGVSFTTKAGNELVRPIVSQKHRCFRNFTRLSERFGGSNVARAKIKRISPVEKSTNPFEEI
jgi:P27 family predicted phage terminase small subunit